MLPALIRKIHLGKALENNDWETIREDLNKFTMEGINGTADKKDIINVLSKYGIKQLLTSNFSLLTSHFSYKKRMHGFWKIKHSLKR